MSAKDPEEMTDVLDVHVFGLPVHQARPRAFKTPTGQIRLYDPANCKDWKRTVLAQVLEHRPAAPVEGPLRMDLVFDLPRPKSAPKRARLTFTQTTRKPGCWAIHYFPVRCCTC